MARVRYVTISISFGHLRDPTSFMNAPTWPAHSLARVSMMSEAEAECAALGKTTLNKNVCFVKTEHYSTA